MPVVIRPCLDDLQCKQKLVSRQCLPLHPGHVHEHQQSAAGEAPQVLPKAETLYMTAEPASSGGARQVHSESSSSATHNERNKLNPTLHRFSTSCYLSYADKKASIKALNLKIKTFIFCGSQ
ncbi:hypothetical protein ATANTOWER_020842 [Ataeniobius toweri]|uniref:Uncharacterized protein n=1 Tax=Ataeniobius toweri TaxID=208326 RepID=A0ABU7CCL2_9TELE|nr:hypothetical protein [Ataeniobius toweri]